MDTVNNITIEEKKEDENGKTKTVGTIIKINLSRIDNNESHSIYLRIRIDFPLQEISGKIIHEYVPKDFLLQSSIEKKQFIDFRLNEKRNLPKTIQEICVNKFLNMRK